MEEAGERSEDGLQHNPGHLTQATYHTAHHLQANPVPPAPYRTGIHIKGGERHQNKDPAEKSLWSHCNQEVLGLREDEGQELSAKKHSSQFQSYQQRAEE